MNDNYTHIVLLIDASGSMEPTKQATIDGINKFLEAQKNLRPQPEVTERNLSFDEDDLSNVNQVKCTVTLVTFSSESRPINNQFGQMVSAGYQNIYSIIQNTSSLLNQMANNGEPEDLFVYSEVYKNTDINSITPLTAEQYDTYGGTPLIDAFCRAINECDKFISSLKEDEKPGRIIFVSYTDGEENSSKQYKKADLNARIDDKQKLNWQFIYLGANQDAISESASYGVMQGQSLTYASNNEGITRSFNALTHNVTAKRCVDSSTMFNCCIGGTTSKEDDSLEIAPNVKLASNTFKVI